MISLFKTAFILMSVMFLNSTCFSRDIVYITIKESQIHYKSTILKILKEDLGVPENLFQIRVLENSCYANKKAILHLCLDEDGNIVVPYSNHKLLHLHLSQWISEAKHEEI